ncbi:MAG TPA: hypothetical protein PK733_12115 [Clostridiales bacterium]|nr:hypothetical protein [Clostridiales bacterium]
MKKNKFLELLVSKKNSLKETAYNENTVSSEAFNKKSTNDKVHAEKIKKAYEILGVREGAGRDEIEFKYYLLAKKHLILKRENIKSEVVGLNMEKINEAYYCLIGIDREKSQDASGSHEKQRNTLLYMLGDHKTAVLICLVILVAAIAVFAWEPVENNINIVIFGEFMDDLVDINSLKDEIRNKLCNTIKHENLIIEEFMLSKELPIPYKIQMMSSAYNFVTQGDYHILIMDKKSFNEYASVANIAKLDSLAEELKLDNEGCYLLKKQFGDHEEHIYGLHTYCNGNSGEKNEEDHLSESSYIVVIKDGLDTKKSKTVTETIKLLVKH